MKNTFLLTVLAALIAVSGFIGCDNPADGGSTKTAEEQALAAITAAKDATEMQKALEDGADALGIDLTAFNSLDAAQKAAVATAVLNAKPADAAAVKATFDEAVAAQSSQNSDTKVTALALSTLVTAPVKNAAPVTTPINTTQYTGTIVWNTSADAVHTGNFAANTVYKAVVTLTAKTGFTFTGLAANAFTYTGATAVTSAANSGVVTITFPATTADTRVLTIDAIPAFTAVTYGYDQPAAKNLTIRNSGNAAATISDVALSGAGASAFVLGGSGSTVNADGSITTRTVQPKAGLTAGTYTETITVTYNSADDTTATAEVSIIVNKATPAYTAPTGLTAIVGQTLADVALPPGFSWDTELNDTTTSVGIVGAHTFNVKFTHTTDAANYNEVKAIPVTVTVSGSLSITIGLNKGLVTVTGPEGVIDLTVPGGSAFTLYKNKEYGSITLSADDGFTGAWYLDGAVDPITTGVNITLNADTDAALDVRKHSISFIGMNDGKPCSIQIPFTVAN
jgi:hypothetical protein